MSQAARLLLFLVIFAGPWTATIDIVTSGRTDSGLDGLVRTATLVMAALLVSAGASLMLGRVIDPARTSPLIHAGRANLALALADIAIFAVVLYGRRSPAAACVAGATCLSYPVVWLALGGMHLCYAVTSYMIKFHTRGKA
jgi:hypothetical protein